MTVQQLLDILNKVEDKSKKVYYNDTLDDYSVEEIEENDEEVFLTGKWIFY